MIVNPNLVEAASLMVLGEYQNGAVLQIDGYPGMFVAESGNPSIQGLHFFSSGDRRFVVGPVLKTEGHAKN